MADTNDITPGASGETSATTHPDAALLADCRAFAEHEARQEKACGPWQSLAHTDPGYPAAEKEADAWYDERDAIMRRLGEAVPRTREGSQARARTVVESIIEIERLSDIMGDATAETLRAVLREATGHDVLRDPDVDLMARASSDAELVALGQDYVTKEAAQRALETVQPATTASCEGSDRINEELPTLIGRAVAFTASRRAGIDAKLAMLRTAAPYALKGLDKVAEEQTRLAWTVVRDLLAIGHDELRDPDAELIAACNRLALLAAEAIRAGEAVTDESDEAYASVVHPIWDERNRLLDAIKPLRARTSDGIAARVRALAASNPVDDQGRHWHSFDRRTDVIGRQLRWLLRDAAALDSGYAP